MVYFYRKYYFCVLWLLFVSFIEVVGGEMGCCVGEEYEFMCVYIYFVWCGVLMCFIFFKKLVLFILISYG